ncbi:hypothetical protein [Nonomuraea sp. NPDC049400]|uniref:hypothetical protein n=1 Tax=Nonomuraea sp. NPDC049400 TaxID=3364352 RepID=UPI0037B4C834
MADREVNPWIHREDRTWGDGHADQVVGPDRSQLDVDAQQFRSGPVIKSDRSQRPPPKGQLGVRPRRDLIWEPGSKEDLAKLQRDGELHSGDWAQAVLRVQSLVYDLPDSEGQLAGDPVKLGSTWREADFALVSLDAAGQQRRLFENQLRSVINPLSRNLLTVTPQLEKELEALPDTAATKALDTFKELAVLKVKDFEAWHTQGKHNRLVTTEPLLEQLYRAELDDKHHLLYTYTSSPWSTATNSNDRAVKAKKVPVGRPTVQVLAVLPAKASRSDATLLATERVMPRPAGRILYRIVPAKNSPTGRDAVQILAVQPQPLSEDLILERVTALQERTLVHQLATEADKPLAYSKPLRSSPGAEIVDVHGRNDAVRRNNGLTTRDPQRPRVRSAERTSLEDFERTVAAGLPQARRYELRFNAAARSELDALAPGPLKRTMVGELTSLAMSGPQSGDVRREPPAGTPPPSEASQRVAEEYDLMGLRPRYVRTAPDQPPTHQIIYAVVRSPLAPRAAASAVTVIAQDGAKMPINGVNRAPVPDELVLYTEKYGTHTPADGGTDVVLDATGKVVGVHAGGTAIAKGNRVLHGSGVSAQWLATHAVHGSTLQMNRVSAGVHAPVQDEDLVAVYDGQAAARLRYRPNLVEEQRRQALQLARQGLSQILTAPVLAHSAWPARLRMETLASAIASLKGGTSALARGLATQERYEQMRRANETPVASATSRLAADELIEDYRDILLVVGIRPWPDPETPAVIAERIPGRAKAVRETLTGNRGLTAVAGPRRPPPDPRITAKIAVLVPGPDGPVRQQAWLSAERNDPDIIEVTVEGRPRPLSIPRDALEAGTQRDVTVQGVRMAPKGNQLWLGLDLRPDGRPTARFAIDTRAVQKFLQRLPDPDRHREGEAQRAERILERAETKLHQRQLANRQLKLGEVRQELSIYVYSPSGEPVQRTAWLFHERRAPDVARLIVPEQPGWDTPLQVPLTALRAGLAGQVRVNGFTQGGLRMQPATSDSALAWSVHLPSGESLWLNVNRSDVTRFLSQADSSRQARADLAAERASRQQAAAGRTTAPQPLIRQQLQAQAVTGDLRETARGQLLWRGDQPHVTYWYMEGWKFALPVPHEYLMKGTRHETSAPGQDPVAEIVMAPSPTNPATALWTVRLRDGRQAAYEIPQALVADHINAVPSLPTLAADAPQRAETPAASATQLQARSAVPASPPPISASIHADSGFASPAWPTVHLHHSARNPDVVEVTVDWREGGSDINVPREALRAALTEPVTVAGLHMLPPIAGSTKLRWKVHVDWEDNLWLYHAWKQDGTEHVWVELESGPVAEFLERLPSKSPAPQQAPTQVREAVQMQAYEPGGRKPRRAELSWRADQPQVTYWRTEGWPAAVPVRHDVLLGGLDRPTRMPGPPGGPIAEVVMSPSDNPKIMLWGLRLTNGRQQWFEVDHADLINYINTVPALPTRPVLAAAQAADRESARQQAASTRSSTAGQMNPSPAQPVRRAPAAAPRLQQLAPAPGRSPG